MDWSVVAILTYPFKKYLKQNVTHASIKQSLSGSSASQMQRTAAQTPVMLYR